MSLRFPERFLPFLLLAAFSSSEAATLRVGVIASVTGRDSALGAQQLAGYAAGVAEVNRRRLLGGDRLALVVKDDASNAPQAVLAAGALAVGVPLVLTFDTNSSVTPLATFAAKRRVPLVLLSGDRSNVTPYVYRLLGAEGTRPNAALRKQLGKNANSAIAVRAYLGVLAAANALRARGGKGAEDVANALSAAKFDTPYGTLRFATRRPTSPVRAARP